MEVYDGTRKNEIFRKFGWKNPMLELVFDYKGEEKRIFVKNESYNLTRQNGILHLKKGL